MGHSYGHLSVWGQLPAVPDPEPLQGQVGRENRQLEWSRKEKKTIPGLLDRPVAFLAWVPRESLGGGLVSLTSPAC